MSFATGRARPNALAATGDGAPAAITLLLISVAAAGAGTREPFQDQAHFEAAIRGFSGVEPPSTNPGESVVLMSGENFVLITVINDRTRRSYRGCVPANALTGAIAIENGLFEDANFERAKEIALSNREHVFRFWNRKALESVLPFDYTARDLQDARQALAAYTREQLLDSSIWQHGRLLMISSATACALIERGLTGLRGDWPSYIQVER